MAGWRTGAWCLWLVGKWETFFKKTILLQLILSENYGGLLEPGVSGWMENRSLVFLAGRRTGAWCFWLDGDPEPGVSGWMENRSLAFLAGSLADPG